MTDDRQTDHAMEKCVGIGGNACDARRLKSDGGAAEDSKVKVTIKETGPNIILRLCQNKWTTEKFIHEWKQSVTIPTYKTYRHVFLLNAARTCTVIQIDYASL